MDLFLSPTGIDSFSFETFDTNDFSLMEDSDVETKDDVEMPYKSIKDDELNDIWETKHPWSLNNSSFRGSNFHSELFADEPDSTTLVNPNVVIPNGFSSNFGFEASGLDNDAIRNNEGKELPVNTVTSAVVTNMNNKNTLKQNTSRQADVSGVQFSQKSLKTNYSAGDVQLQMAISSIQETGYSSKPQQRYSIFKSANRSITTSVHQQTPPKMESSCNMRPVIPMNVAEGSNNISQVVHVNMAKAIRNTSQASPLNAAKKISNANQVGALNAAKTIGNVSQVVPVNPAKAISNTIQVTTVNVAKAVGKGKGKQVIPANVAKPTKNSNISPGDPVNVAKSVDSKRSNQSFQAPTGWKNSVRHNLSLNKCFEKIEKPVGSTQRKGCLWALNAEKALKLEDELQKWMKKDLSSIKRSMEFPDHFDLLEKGELKWKIDISSASEDDDDNYDLEYEDDANESVVKQTVKVANAKDSVHSTNINNYPVLNITDISDLPEFNIEIDNYVYDELMEGLQNDQLFSLTDPLGDDVDVGKAENDNDEPFDHYNIDNLLKFEEQVAITKKKVQKSNGLRRPRAKRESKSFKFKTWQ